MNYWNKNKRPGGGTQKRNNWNQSLRLPKTSPEPTQIRKSLQYILILKKFDNVFSEIYVKLLSAFIF
jgi:hypothetical protein